MVTNTTFEASPSSPPRDLTVVPLEDNPSAINLNWLPPKQPNGQITGTFSLFYRVSTAVDFVQSFPVRTHLEPGDGSLLLSNPIRMGKSSRLEWNEIDHKGTIGKALFWVSLGATGHSLGFTRFNWVLLSFY